MEHALMDEDTLDCRYCSQDATCEVRHQYLGDNAEWLLKDKIMLCDEHLGRVEIMAFRLLAHQRVIILRSS